MSDELTEHKRANVISFKFTKTAKYYYIACLYFEQLLRHEQIQLVSARLAATNAGELSLVLASNQLRTQIKIFDLLILRAYYSTKNFIVVFMVIANDLQADKPK